AVDFGHARRRWIAAQVVHHALLPEIGPIPAADALVDAHDAADVELVEGPDPSLLLDVGHEVLPETRLTTVVGRRDRLSGSERGRNSAQTAREDPNEDFDALASPSEPGSCVSSALAGMTRCTRFH